MPDNLAEGGGETFETGVDLGLADHQRRDETDDVAERAAGQGEQALSVVACCTARAVAASGLPSAPVNSIPSMSPLPRTSPMTPWSVRIFSRPAVSCTPRWREFSTSYSSSKTSRVAQAAAAATALPP